MTGANPNRAVVWAALIAGPVAYAGIVLSGVLPVRVDGVSQAVLAALGVAALASVLLSRLLWARLVAGAEEAAGRGVRESRGGASGADTVLTRAIVVWALDESVALFGFVLAWLGAPITLCAPFFIVSLALLAMDHPGRLS